MAMSFQGAIVSEQGTTFAVIIVKDQIIKSMHTAIETMKNFSEVFPKLPIILMAQDEEGVPTYVGRKDIVTFLSNLDYRMIPWKQYNL